MQIKILDEMKKIGYVLQNATSEEEAVEEILNELKKLFKSNIVLINDDGKILNQGLISEVNILNKSSYAKSQYIDDRLNEQLLGIEKVASNFNLNELYLKDVTRAEVNKYNAIIAPIISLGERLATLVVYKELGRYDRVSVVAVEYAVNILGLIIKSKKNARDEENVRKIATVKAAISTLSYSELEAIMCILPQLEGKEGVVVASKIAKEAMITRSVIVNALRKCESAGVIESHSLGMKGTYIKILNEYMLKEIERLKNNKLKL